MTKMFSVRIERNSPGRSASANRSFGGASAFSFRSPATKPEHEIECEQEPSATGNVVTDEGAANSLMRLIERRRHGVAALKLLELPFLLAVGLGPSTAVWLAQGRQLFVFAVSATSVALAIGIIISWYALGRLKDHANSRHLSYVLPICVTVFTSILAALALLRIPYSASFFALGAAHSIATNFALAVYSRRLKAPHLVISGGRTSELILSDHFYPAPALEILEGLIDSGHRSWALVADLHFEHCDQYERLFARAALNGIPVYHYRAVAEMQSGQVKINHLSENDLGSLIPNMSYVSVKRMIDSISALILLPLCAPLFVVLALIIKADSRGPAFFLQSRMGFRGKPFTMVKFRTMHVPRAEEKSIDKLQVAMTTRNDVRITRVGAFLRKTRIDELPQILNVLAGQMSFIGPRPEAISLSEWYESELPFYSYRHIVRPGITGWAQVNQGHVTDVTDVLSKLRFDFYYIKHFSLWLDLLTALKTLRVIVTGTGAK